MTLILSGTDGLSDIDGTAATPAIRGTDANTGIFFDTDIIGFAEGGVEAMRIDSSGNLNFTGTAQRITGDFSNATIANRVAFQTSTTNGNTIVPFIPNGTSTNAQVVMYNDSGATNSSTGQFSLSSTELRIAAGIVGTGTYLPMTFYTGASERVRIDTSGNVGIGNTPQGNWKLQVNGGSLLAVGGGATGYAGFRLNSQTLPTSDDGTVATLAHAIGGNYSSGSAEMDFFNCVNNAGGFHFYQKTGAASATKVMEINGSGNLTISGSTATKASGTTWANPSDVRLKDNIQNYTKGLPELMQVNVKTWEYNGKGGTTKGMNGLGVIADEVMTVLPDTVETYDDKLNADDEETTAIKKFDATEITWLLVKTVQEQQALITALTARITALEPQNADNTPQGETP